MANNGPGGHWLENERMVTIGGGGRLPGAGGKDSKMLQEAGETSGETEPCCRLGSDDSACWE